MSKIDLRRLILLLALSTGVVTFANGLYSSYLTQRDLLMNQALAANRVYAAKQALNTDNFILSAQAHLAFSAQQLTHRMRQSERLSEEVDRLRLQSNDFNSAFVVGNDGRVLATSPAGLGLVGVKLKTEGGRAILGKREPVITEPYVGSTRHLLIVMSHPILGANGEYQGYISASIYLQERNILKALLDEDYRNDGSYAYVVDRRGRLIYHPEASRIGEMVIANPAVQQLIKGKEGTLRLINLKGVDMLTGYAIMKSTGWGIVAQTPTASTLAVLDQLMLDTLLQTLPLSLLTLLGIWWLSHWISRPLRRLAQNVQAWEEPEALDRLREIKTWYFEADHLKSAIIQGLSLLQQRLGKLNRYSLTDPLTGLNNRRGLRFELDKMLTAGKGFSVISLDIDHFKEVNDLHGHDVGDSVLKFLAEQMQACFRSDDVLCRSGGEEFVVLLPGLPITDAHRIAERLRLDMATQPSPSGHIVTISIGVAYMPAGGASVESVLKESDAALYKAKCSGRNCVISAAHPST
ncbi:diguanylate cyclase (GGDEF)-like protein [Pseudomonas fluvialis]|uniref:diguanylate cyclase n=1 Tax=Pseudomonas fluvialis TaxID=1793966 RepID=A0A7X0ESJ6_9PSED|nr:sensor domain-containing diguanylate cyclase [Pseudomonas fluvialis]MBB6342348.1 diguanylate cyclase (GGDEF)-like protein [Pseudomonas fluvialis]